MRLLKDEELELTILMPCLNEESAVEDCVKDALQFLGQHGIRGEVLVADNGSTDQSVETAVRNGARVVIEPRTGYGRALRAGIRSSTGRIIIMGDCDTTYDFLQIEPMYRLLADDGYDMVIGNRYAGSIEHGAMPVSHLLGGKFLSMLGRWRFRTDIRDFHCGLRGITRNAAEQMNLRTPGMEFATEMIGEAVKRNMRITQLPVKLKRCKCGRSSKLKTVRDGMRHLRYIMSYRNERFKII